LTQFFEAMPGNFPAIENSSTLMLPQEFTLIVAATNKMGIGLRGMLPWTGLKKEMAYFARVTKGADPNVWIPFPILNDSDAFTDEEYSYYGSQNLG
jgi:hypothetical protein